MSEKFETFFTVEANQNWHGYDRFSTLEEATDKARATAWSSANTQYVMKQVAKVEAPELVNTAKVTTL